MKIFRPFLWLLTSGLLASTLILGCESTEKLQEDSAPSTTVQDPETPKVSSTPTEESKTESGINLDQYRSSLNDVYSSRTHDIPGIFMDVRPEKEDKDRDVYAGFRIQIISSRNLARADNTADEFKQWARDLGVGYVPESYIIFKQPYYRVHVGDFSEREQAIDFSRLVKRKYPDAWVVHDRINPYRTPADSVMQQFD